MHLCTQKQKFQPNTAASPQRAKRKQTQPGTNEMMTATASKAAKAAPIMPTIDLPESVADYPQVDDAVSKQRAVAVRQQEVRLELSQINEKLQATPPATALDIAAKTFLAGGKLPPDDLSVLQQRRAELNRELQVLDRAEQLAAEGVIVAKRAVTDDFVQRALLPEWKQHASEGAALMDDVVEWLRDAIRLVDKARATTGAADLPNGLTTLIPTALSAVIDGSKVNEFFAKDIAALKSIAVGGASAQN